MSARLGVLGLATFFAGMLAAGAASAQTTLTAVPGIGVLLSGARGPGFAAEVSALRKALGELGYVEGGNIQVHERFAENQADLLPGLARELAELRVSVIVTAGTTAVRSAVEATSAVPIVIAGSGDPVAMGFAQSLSHPGGRITGLSIMGEELIGKRVALLHELLPQAHFFAGLFNSANPGNAVWKKAMETAAASLGIRFRTFDVDAVDQLGPVFGQIAALKPDGLILIEDPLFISYAQTIAELALQYRLPTAVGSLANLRAGALFAYAFDHADLWRRAAFYVDRILRGMPAGELPIEQPTRFNLALNLKTAKALALDIPPSLLARADEVIE